MIRGIGIDAVEIERFAQWHQLSRKHLSRIFSDYEIDYCLSVPAKSAERFAARFAAKEAFFKALSVAVSGHELSLLTICRHVSVMRRGDGAPGLQVNWSALCLDQYSVHVSTSHTKIIAVSVVIFEQ